MKKISLTLVLCFLSLLSFAQAGRLNYAIAIAKFKNIYNAQQADSLYAMFSPRMQAALPIPKAKELLSSLHQQLGKLNETRVEKETSSNINYRGVFEKAEVTILFTLNEKNQLSGLFFVPVKEGENETKKAPSNFSIKTNKGSLVYGTLEMPAVTDKRANVVLIIAGSGPTDRDGNSTMGIRTDAYKMLADSLKKAGIASVRYDKRGIGESMDASGAESEVRFDDMVDDAVRLIRRIKEDGRFAKIYVLGHSEGSLIGMLAAQREPIDGFISLAGAGESADVTLKRQIKTGMADKAKEADRVLNLLKRGDTVTVTDDALKDMFRSSVQPYLISWFAYDPQVEIRKVHVPVLIIQGKTDIQVGVTDAQQLKKARPQATLLLVDQMNHVLKAAPAERTSNIATYNNPALPVVKECSDAVIRFCASGE